MEKHKHPKLSSHRRAVQRRSSKSENRIKLFERYPVTERDIFVTSLNGFLLPPNPCPVLLAHYSIMMSKFSFFFTVTFFWDVYWASSVGRRHIHRIMFLLRAYHPPSVLRSNMSHDIPWSTSIYRKRGAPACARCCFVHYPPYQKRKPFTRATKGDAQRPFTKNH
jgi:hypothetical protein